MNKFFTKTRIATFLFASVGIYSCYAYSKNESLQKVVNVAYAGFQMGRIYKYSKETTTEKHAKASIFLRDALSANGGIYVKLGQLIATLDVVVPD